MSCILHIVGDSKYGGGAVLIERLAAEAKNAGYTVGVLTTDTVFQNRLKTLGIEVVGLQCIWRNTRPLRDLIGLIRLVRYLVSSKWTLVHTHTSKAGIIGRIASTMARIPAIIHTTHGFAFHEKSPPWQIRLFATAEKLAAYFCHKIVYVSKFHCDWAKQLQIGSSEQRIAIPNGIPSLPVNEITATTVPTEHSKSVSSALRCLTVGRLAPQKGLDTLITAASIIEKSDCHIHYELAGEGPIRDAIVSEVHSRGLAQQFRFLGFRTDIDALLEEADIVIQPSVREGLSIVLLEAMRQGKPIIAAAIGSNLEASNYGETAELFEANNHQALADSIHDLINNEKKRTQLGRRAAQRFQSCYTEDRMIHGYLELYKAVTKKR